MRNNMGGGKGEYNMGEYNMGEIWEVLARACLDN